MHIFRSINYLGLCENLRWTIHTRMATAFSKRRGRRIRTEYELRHACAPIARVAMNAEQTSALLCAIENNQQAMFGLCHLASLDLNTVCSTSRGALTLLEYAARLGRDAMVASLLRAGADPSVSQRAPSGLFVAGSGTLAENVLLKRLWSESPAVAAYWVILISDARCRTFAASSATSVACAVCGRDEAPLVLARPCAHTCCEQCLWMRIIDAPPFADPVFCPICGSVLGEEHGSGTHTAAALPPSEIAAASKQLWMALPATAGSDGAPPPKPRFRALSRAQASALFMGTCQATRSCEVNKAAVAGDARRLTALIVAGANLEDRNEYGQTPLLIAAWHGQINCMLTLLQNGADATVMDDAGVSVAALARTTLGQTEFCQLAPFLPAEAFVSQHVFIDLACDDATSQPTLTVLIDGNRRHPGAGSFVVDHIVGESVLARLEAVHARLPVATATKASPNQRSYYLDSTGWVQHALMASIDSIRSQFVDHHVPVPESVFPAMRFLHYVDVGGYVLHLVGASIIFQDLKYVFVVFSRACMFVSLSIEPFQFFAATYRPEPDALRARFHAHLHFVSTRLCFRGRNSPARRCRTDRATFRD
jgi:hypothetical protein